MNRNPPAKQLIYGAFSAMTPANGTVLIRGPLDKTRSQTMPSSDSLLRRHLGWIIAIKLSAITALWWFFVRDAEA